jgi:hypothetical protein
VIIHSESTCSRRSAPAKVAEDATTAYTPDSTPMLSRLVRVSSCRAVGVIACGVLIAACGRSPAVAGGAAQTPGFLEEQPATAPPPPAADVVAAAVRAASAGQKAVLIEFGASWCVWCRHFDAFTHAPGVREILNRHYVIANLTVLERDAKKGLENPGSEAKLNEWGGAASGLPFYVFLDGTGRKIADSKVMPGGGNIGFPAVPAERDAFMRLLDRTAPTLTPTDRATLLAWLTSDGKASEAGSGRSGS